MLRLVRSFNGGVCENKILRKTKNLNTIAIGSKSTWTTFKDMSMILVRVNPSTNSITLLNNGDGSVE